MSTTSILSVIQYYQRSIEKYQTDEARLLHCVSKLYNLPVKVEHLQETGIGKTVNSLRKYEGEIGSAAKALVAKWKAMVAAEEEPMETNCNQDETNNSSGNGGDTDDEDHYDQNRNSDKIECDEPSPNQAKERGHTEVHNKNKEKGHHKDSSSNSHHKSSSLTTHTDSSTSSKHKSKSSYSSSSTTEKKKSHSDTHHKSRARDDEKKEQTSDKLKEKEIDERKKEDKHKSSSSSRHKESSNSHKKEHSNSSQEHHSKKSKSSPDSHKESSHRHSSHSKANKDHENRCSSASKEKERKIQKDTERTHEKHKSTSKEREHSHSKKKHTSSSKPTSSSSSSDQKSKNPASTPTDHTLASSSSSSAERKRRRHSSEHDSSNESVVLKPKAIKQSKAAVSEEHDNDEADFIDSSMGANFADVLGMLNKPSKKSKKLSSALKSPIANVKASSSTHAKSSSSSSLETQHKTSSSKVNGVRSSTSSSVASTPRKSDMKPDLLSSSTKLEPLDPSIVLELPSISTNYKPMPLNQTVMDCVFASSSSYSNAPKAPVRTLTDAEALHHGISSKTMRTKIYSGVRTGQLMQVTSLFDLCIRVLQKNIDALEYTGGVPFEVLRPVLDRATPQQLLIFEEYNPYLMEDSDALWQQHVQRHYRAQKRKEMESWREMFLRCQEDQERKLNILAESIKQSQKIIAAPVRKTQLAFVDSMVKPPRNVQRKQEQYGTKSKLIATPASRVASLSSVTPNAVKTGDARLRVAATVRDHAQVSNAIRPKKAPLMAKTLQLMRGRQKR